MPLALPFDGVAPLFLYVLFHPFELGHTSVERKVLVESLELRGEVSLLIAPSPMAMLLQPCIGTVQDALIGFRGLMLPCCPRSGTHFQGYGKIRAPRRRERQKSGCTPSAHPRPWNQTRAMHDSLGPVYICSLIEINSSVRL